MSETVDDDTVVVEVPGYRVDLEREVDLIEEVVRVQGYENVGSTLPAIKRAGELCPPRTPSAGAFAKRSPRRVARGSPDPVRLR